MVIMVAVLADDEAAGGVHLVHQTGCHQEVQGAVDAHGRNAGLDALQVGEQVVGLDAARMLAKVKQDLDAQGREAAAALLAMASRFGNEDLFLGRAGQLCRFGLVRSAGEGGSVLGRRHRAAERERLGTFSLP